MIGEKFTVLQTNNNQTNPVSVSLRCPFCGENAALETVAVDTIISACIGAPSTVAGARRCPSPKCHALILVVLRNHGLVTAYPKSRIDFDGSNVPSAVLAALVEAITCHAEECYIAAAIMIRKTLEEICHERGAVGGNLCQRIKALGGSLLIPAELIDGMNELRLLGNDAAHIESQTFNQVSKEEVEVGIEFTKEILKATYQYQHLLGRLRALKAAPAPTAGVP